MHDGLDQLKNDHAESVVECRAPEEKLRSQEAYTVEA